MKHPGFLLNKKIQAKGLTQRAFSSLIGKNASEVNELVKGKRNITVMRDIILSDFFQTPEKYRISKQIDYDYGCFKRTNKASEELLASTEDNSLDNIFDKF